MSLSMRIDAKYINLGDNKKGVRFSTQNAIGDIVALLESEFPNISNESMVENLRNEIEGHRKAKKILGFPERGGSLLEFYEYVDGRKSIKPSLKDIEQLRFECGYSAPRAINKLNPDDGIIFYNLHNISEVLFSILNYYARYDYTLKRCKFCGKWFAAPKVSAQSGYCNRGVKYNDCLGKDHKYSSCIEARKDILNRCKARYNRIYNVIYQNSGSSFDKMTEFTRRAGELKESCYSFSDCVKYENYLYMDCEKFYSRYGRNK